MTVLGLLAGCGGGGGDEPAVPDYSGTWDIRYNLVQDQCALVASRIPGFTDQHIIHQNGLTAELSAMSSLIISRNAVVREDGSLLAEEVLYQDLLGDGSLCEMHTRVSYQDLADDTATTMYELDITCREVFSCSSQALGGAVRQPGEPPDVEVDEDASDA